MNHKIFFIVCSFLIFSACSSGATQEQLEEAQNSLAQAEEQLEVTKVALAEAIDKIADKGDAGPVLVHTVYFKLKDDLTSEDQDKFIELLKSLSQIDYIKDVEVGTPEDTGDPRLFTDYDVALLMEFKSEADLAKYQKDEFHLERRTQAGPYLAGPPVVYDYFTK